MILHGDCLTVLQTMPEASIDACVTDPPYGIGFMAKEWDVPGGIGAFPMRRRVETDAVNTGVTRQGGRQRSCEDFAKRQKRDAQAFEAEAERWAAEVFRVLKPGAYIAAFGGTRMYHRMTAGIEDAGFEIRDCLSWLYGSGFPKSLNLPSGRGTALKPSWEPIILARKPLTGTVAANVERFGTGALNIDATRIRPTSQDDSRSTSGDSSAYTSLLRGVCQILRIAHSELLASSDEQHETLASLLANALAHDLQNELHEGFQAGCLPCRGCDDGRVRLVGAVGRASVRRRVDALEPLDLQWIASRIRDCRCDAHPSIWDAMALRVSSSNYSLSDVEKRGRYGEQSAERRYAERGATDFAATPGPRGGDALGRWPANVLLDEEAAAVLDAQSGELTSGEPCGIKAGGQGNAFGYYPGGIPVTGFGDSGGASRFYYVAKPSREERDYGTEGLTARQRDDSRKDGNPGGDNPRNRGLQQRGNFHPTVKPVELMRWLVRLVTPPGGTVLDPFMGSGTTGMACRYELRPFIGIEREADYIAIAERRIEAVAPLFGETA